MKKIVFFLSFVLFLSGCGLMGGFVLDKESCDAIVGWKWSSDIGACVSKDLTDGKGMYTWNGYGTFFSHGNDESPQTKDNRTPEYGTTYAFVDFECVVNVQSETLQKRMELANLAQWSDLVKMLDKDNDLAHPTALAIADCIDGVKDLDFSSFADAGGFVPNWTQEEPKKRNCYLSGEPRAKEDFQGINSECSKYGIFSVEDTWAWKTGNPQFQANSHLPTPWEFVFACGKDSGDAFNFDATQTFCWTSAIGHISGADWAFGARNLGKDSCEKQNFEDTGAVNDIYGFRVVVRPSVN